MTPHDLHLFVRQIAWLAKNVVGDSDLANVMKRRGTADQLYSCIRKSGVPSEIRGQVTDSVRMPSSVVIVNRRSSCKTLENFDLRLLELRSSLPDSLFHGQMEESRLE